MHKILLLGPQGCGKGTQATILSERLRIPQFSMGQLLREAAHQEGSLAERIRHIQARGDLVSGEIVMEVLRARLRGADTQRGYILDGFPRDQDQYLAYAIEDRPTAVIVLHVPREVSIARLMNRARIEKRLDDTPEIIAHRLDIYEQETDPMINNYRSQGLVRDVDGEGTVEEVAERIYGVCAIKGGC